MTLLKKTVALVAPTLGMDQVFKDMGWLPVIIRRAEELDVKPDLLCFCGGADIHPKLYGQLPHPTTYPDTSRDEREIKIWNKFRDVPKVGVCRGAQLLCALNGGTLWQNVNKHEHGNHYALDIRFERKVMVSSVHHQMCRLASDMELIAYTQRSTLREDINDTDEGLSECDVEAFWIPKDRALCVQFHPEFGPQPCEEYFGELMERYFA